MQRADVRTYAEDPRRGAGDFFGREVMAEFRRAASDRRWRPIRIANWREMGHAVMLNAVDIPLADPHF